MPARERVQREKSKSEARREEIQNVKTSSSDELKDDIDTLLDEVDSVLEENAEEFVKGYVQKGGE